jgi:predicted DNA-binding transcriptional regulator YafY
MKTDGGARKTERLLDLLVTLLNADHPIPFAELRNQFPDYKTKNPDAGARTFERDKQQLVLLGVPLRCLKKGEIWPPGGEEELDDDGYLVDREQYLLPALDLARDEIAALAVVAEVARAQAAFPYREEIDSALRKITWDVGAPEAAPDVRLDLRSAPMSRSQQKQLRQLEEAVHGRKRITVKYKKMRAKDAAARDIDPYGLVYRSGTWLLVGWCHVRKEVRTFRVDRLLQVKVAPRPGEPDFERPAGLDVRAQALRSPWKYQVEAPTRVVLETAPEWAHLLREDFGAGAERSELPAGGARIAFECANPGYVVSRVLAAAGRLRVVEPQALRARVGEAAEQAAERYA